MGRELASKSNYSAQDAHYSSPKSTGISITPAHRVLQLQRAISNQGVLRELEEPGFVSSLGDGRPLSRGERAFYEPRFGHSFGNVRVHDDEAAAESASAINARAYASGNHIVVGQDQYDPLSTAAKRLMAHELTHTIQQGSSANSGHTPDVQREEFSPWPGQTGTDVAGTREQDGDIIREQVQRTGDPTYTQLGPMLLEFDSSTCVLTVKKEIQFVRAGTGDDQMSEEDFNELKTRVLEIANDKLNGWVSIQAGDADECPCSGKTIEVKVVTTEGAGSYSSTVNLHPTYGREDAGNIGDDSSDRTIWHEVGHIVLGAADEYAESNRPDGTPRPHSKVNASDWSVMGSDRGTRRSLMHARHFSHLPAWLGRRFPDCSFSLVESAPVVIEISPYAFLGGFGIPGGTGGLYYSAGLDLGIPLDRLRRLELVLGFKFDYLMRVTSPAQQALLLGFKAGLEGQFAPEGVRVGGFLEGGGVGITDLETGELGALPYFGSGVGVGYSFGSSFNFSVEAAAGGREVSIPDPIPGGQTSEIVPYYRVGLMLGGSF